MPAATTHTDPQALAEFVAAWERYARAARRARGRANQAPSQQLTYAQYLLAEPLLHEEPLAVCQLAEAAAVAQPTTTRMLAGLVRDGVVRRRPDADDRRVALIELTDAGRARVAAKREEIVGVRRRIFESLPEAERGRAAALLDRLAVAVEKL